MHVAHDARHLSALSPESIMTTTHILGFPRIGAARELKFATEAFWRGESDAADLAGIAHTLRARHWQWQREAGLDWVSVGDFSLYDTVLDTVVGLGALPARFGFDAATLTLTQYFALARGNAAQPAMEMSKWFDTNYHFLRPEFDADTRFDGEWSALFAQIDEARAAGYPVKVQVLGPITLLRLARVEGISPLALLARLVPAYLQLLHRLLGEGIRWVQLDEPALALDLDPAWTQAAEAAYRALGAAHPGVLLATYFGAVDAHARWIKTLPLGGLHLDLVRGPAQWSSFQDWPGVLSLGVIDGRNVWRADLDAWLDRLEPIKRRLGDRLWLASSCSLLHVPTDLNAETALDPMLKDGVAFARQKLTELTTLSRALDLGRSVCFQTLDVQRAALARFRAHPGRHDPALARRLAERPESDRGASYAERRVLQQARLRLPLLPTTTIGSFPQTPEIRAARAAWRRGQFSEADYRAAMRREIAHAVARQEALGLDVLVHGEAERSDMVDYFAEQLTGVAVTAQGWVQSYGTRCVKPPIIWGDVSRPADMTVEWTAYAASLTAKPMKAMLTGPVTLTQWSFVRDDLPRARVALQFALALRDEVAALDAAGAAVIQIDEPAFREGLPLRETEWADYLDWAVAAFKIAAAGARPETQIHTHMCYSDFEDILPAIAALDADVITIETARSAMALLDAFADFAYPNEIGPGVYDIHSPRVPDESAMRALLERALAVIPAERLWVNPDCGLKTRGWPETEAALANMVAAARALRAQLGATHSPASCPA
jgi:5-methyltetrahydropteroyltriglutamate--homocysteine methyltransferase